MIILEKDETMAFISGFRRRAIDEGKIEGLMEGIQTILEIKFGDVPNEILSKIKSISDLASTLSCLKFRIKSLKLDPCIGSCKLPVNLS